MTLCDEKLPSRSRRDAPGLHRCHKERGHSGKHAEFPFLSDLAANHPKVRAKIIRDATQTTGAAWKSEDAGPNRISRWHMLLTPGNLKKIGVDLKNLRPGVIAKLRQKAATYPDCISVAQKLTFMAYGMENAPNPPRDIRDYLVALFGPIVRGSTVCLVCEGELNFDDFEHAQRGRAELETAHADPRSHSRGNVGFAHRECNIAQGDKTLSEFESWIKEILTRKGYSVTP